MGKATIAICSGCKESGKTWTARRILWMHRRVLAVEWKGELAEPEVAGAITTRNDAEFYQALRANAAKKGPHRDRWCIVHAPEFEPGEGSELVARCAYVVGDCCAVFEEAHNYMTAQSCGPWMGRLIREARHAGDGAGANLVFCSPRLADITTDARTQADLWVVCGSVWTATDRDTIGEYTSEDFKREIMEPLKDGEHRQVGFDTRTRKRFDVTPEELRRRFRLEKGGN